MHKRGGGGGGVTPRSRIILQRQKSSRFADDGAVAGTHRRAVVPTPTRARSLCGTTHWRKHDRKQGRGGGTGTCSLGSVKILSLGIGTDRKSHFGNHPKGGVTTIDEIAITCVVWSFDSSDLTGTIVLNIRIQLNNGGIDHFMDGGIPI